MSRGHRSLTVILLAGVLAGCATTPSPTATPSPSTSAPAASASAGTAPPVPSTSAGSVPSAPSSGSPVVSTPPSQSPQGSTSPSPVATPGPPHVADFVIPAPPPATAAWTGIRWQKVSAASPLAHVRSVTRWAGGFIAVGDLVVSGTSAHTKVWVSADGSRWDLLDAGVFGASALVVGVAPTTSGVVALTLQSDAPTGNGAPTEIDGWTMTGPWQTWTSSDGLTWAAHPGPAFPLPHDMSGDSYPTLVAGAGGHVVAIVFEEQPLAFSADGIAWQTASLDAFPGGPAGWGTSSLVGFGPGFVMVGSSGTRVDFNGRVAAAGSALSLTSADGRTWTPTILSASCPAAALTVAARGLILSGDVGDEHNAKTLWCSSVDGRSWRPLPGLPPIGYMTTNDECRGTCPNGILTGDGERMLAYRAYPKPTGWISPDGRSWTRLAFSGSLPPRSDSTGNTYNVETFVVPIGLFVVDLNTGTTWYGRPVT